jgi:hypothetical protein
MNAKDVRAGAVGALTTAAAFVAVYEGKVAVSHAAEAVTLSAGEGADVGAGGVRKAADVTAAESAFDAATASAGGDPAMRANESLVASMSDYRARLERMVVERRALEQQLADARARLEAADGGGKLPTLEVTPDDWKELAKTGTIRMRIPCQWKGGWWPSAKQLDALGLAPADARTIQDATNSLYESEWAAIRPLCAKIAGPDIADKLGLDGCPNFIFTYQKGANKEAAMEAMRRVSEMRAGLLATPAPDDPTLSPVESVFLALTGQQSALEAELAQSFGPDEAHRLVTSSSFCGFSSTWNGPGPRERNTWGEKTKFE